MADRGMHLLSCHMNGSIREYIIWWGACVEAYKWQLRGPSYAEWRQAMTDGLSYEELKAKVKELENSLRASRRVENALRESEQLSRTLSEKSLAGIYVVQNGTFRFVNANIARYAGNTPQGMVGMKADSVVHPDDRQRVKRNAREMLSGRRTSPHDFRIITT